MADESFLTQSAKRSFSELQDTCVRRPKDDQGPPQKKKFKTKLIDLFKRTSMAMNQDECTQVYLRIKPFAEDEDSSLRCLKVIPEENAVVATAPDSSHAHKSSTRGRGKSSNMFTFSKIFDESTNQAQFFNHTMLEMTKQFIGGQNMLVFSYGVTSSGKTYTIQGKPQDAGILPRSLDVLFNSITGKQIANPKLKPEMFMDVVRLSEEDVIAEQKIKKQTLKMGVNDDPTMMSLMGEELESALSDTAMSSSSGVDELLADVMNRDREKLTVDVEEKMRFGVWVSFAEVYNEQVFDLLVPVPQKKSTKRPTLRICDDRNGNPYIKGLKEIHVESADEAYKLLTIGQRNLQTACTRLNHCSSRSHCIFNIKIVRVVDKEDPNIACVSTLSLCDLAGSERYSKTQATGDRLKEAGNINTSLMTLGRCIETLRHNQLHRDQQRLVPFRDSKLTRILQNFFNGCGKAAMIVNVSQSTSMFDDTLHVFKFSAIAKQVKYEKLPEVKKPPREKKSVPPIQRQTISWESHEGKQMLKNAETLPLPEEEDDIEIFDVEFDESASASSSDEKSNYIQCLEMRNQHLIEMLAAQMSNATNNENRIRREVMESMQKQMVLIEENYSAMLKDAADDVEELADERVKGIMEVYERRLERIQKKVDEEDEWVSSMLYHQEKMKVEERDAKIVELEKQLEEQHKQPQNHDSIDMGNSVLVETLTQKLQEAADANSSKDAQIEELKSLVEEAGETYTMHIKEIKGLRESLAEQEKCNKQLRSLMADHERQISQVKENSDKAQKALDEKEKELLASCEELHGKLKSKDATINSLEEECKELQEEIERLQDQMSQIDEQSRCQEDFDSSMTSEPKLKLVKKNLSISCTEDLKPSVSQLKIGKENICDVDNLTKTKQRNKELLDEIATVKSVLENSQKQMVILKTQSETLESSHSSTLKELEVVNKDLETCKQSLDEAVKELENVKGESEQHAKDLVEAKQEVGRLEKCILQIQEQNEQLKNEKESCERVQAELGNELRELEEKYEHLRTAEKSCEISQMVKMIEEKTTPHKTPSKSVNQAKENDAADDDDDDEVVFNVKNAHSSPSKTPLSLAREKTPMKNTPSLESSCTELAVKLKDSEMANAALRSKLKHEEEDFFKREQALIHGYTAEIDSLKFELAKCKTKADPGLGGKPQRGKKREHMDISSCSSVSESYCESAEEKSACPRLKGVEESPGHNEYAAIVSNEVLFLQEQLASVMSAFRQVERSQQNCDLKNTSQDVEKPSKAARYSINMSSAPRYSLTNSVLMFEKEEFAIKMEEAGSKAAQLEAEVRTLSKKLEQESKAKAEAEQKYQGMLETKNLEGLETAPEADEQVQILTKELQEARQVIEEIKQAKEKLESEVETKETAVSKLKETIEMTINLKDEAESATKLNDQKLQVLTANIEAVSHKLTEAIHERDQLQKNLQQTKDQLASTFTDLESVKSIMAALQKELVEKSNQLVISEENLKHVEQALVRAKEELKKLQTESKNLGERCSALEKTIVEKESCLETGLKRAEEDYSQRLHTLEEQLSFEGKSKVDAISSLQHQLTETAMKFEAKSKELANLESLRQEEAAEVAQKLIALEREKKAAERRAGEACSKKEEMELKFQGYEKLSQEFEQLQGKLHEASASVEECQALVTQLRGDLVLKTEEIKQLREKESAFVSTKHNIQVLEAQVSHLEQQVAKELSAKQCALTELIESEKTMDQQENILTKQDEEIKNLKTELDTLKSENENLDKALTRLEIEKSTFSKQVQKHEDELGRLRGLERQLWEQERRDKLTHDKLQESSSELTAMEARLEDLKQDNAGLLERENQLVTEKEALQEELERARLKIEDHVSQRDRLVEKVVSVAEELTAAMQKKKEAELRAQDLESELEKVSKASEEKEGQGKLQVENNQLTEETEKLKNDLKKTLEKLREAEKVVETKKTLEKELQKQESMNKRNREEMENWKAERDTCVKRLEQMIEKMMQEKNEHTEEIKKLKKSNADLAQEANSIASRKDAVISELRVSNNRMSIQLAESQGKSPPPKMATPELSFPTRMRFDDDDVDTSGHLELDVTPVAAKKGKKRQASSRQTAAAPSSSVDPEATAEPKCLRTIKEEAESPSCTSSKSPRHRVAGLASEVFASLSPLTRTPGKKQSSRKKVMQPPFETMAYGATPVDTPEESSVLTRRSSRLRKQKHSLV